MIFAIMIEIINSENNSKETYSGAVPKVRGSLLRIFASTMTPFENAYTEVAGLVSEFSANEDHYLSSKYQEAEVREDFLNKFWTSLGWDVRHVTQTNPREQEVKVEKNPDSSASGRRADYAFYLKPDYKNPQFFVEAKKPSRKLSDPEFYFQTVRYGYNAGTPICVLTDFEEFHIIDCRYEPNINKSFPSAQIKALHYKDYLDRDKFGYIYWLFSREAVEGGKLKELAKELPKQKGKGKTKLTIEESRPVDEAFLTKLEEYRLTLAKAFKKADETLTAEDLTEATQKVIDRLVFIRFLEDKNIESDYIVDEIAGKGGNSGTDFSPSVKDSRTKVRPTGLSNSAWKSFISWSKELDVKYNGIVFKPHDIDKPGFKAPDDKVFAELCSDISHKQSKYLFSYIPIEILGSIYERFLGKVVTATAKRADIEYKPEVRKAGGVYYTPKYIVDYIVGNTVGKILGGENNSNNATNSNDVIARPAPAGRGNLKSLGQPENFEIATSSLSPSSKETPRNDTIKNSELSTKNSGLTPKEISKLRFADIACGSGSFLIAVYDAVLHYCESYYNANPDEAKKAGCIEIDKGIYSLSLKQKQQILIDNIFGVDIDHQAVEVAQLSLFLKLLESESGASAGQLSFEKTKILPDLSKNILCGNSLVEYDIADLFPLTSEDEARIKPFDFKTSFKQVMDKGGFDAIVGNPPYVRQESLGELKNYFQKKYEVSQGTADLYTYFIERGVSLLKEGGKFSYIVANKWMRVSYGAPLRNWMKKQCLEEILDFGDLPVFKGATTYPCIIRIAKKKNENIFYACNIKSLDFIELGDLVDRVKFKVTFESLGADGWSLTDSLSYDILTKIKSQGTPLKQIVDDRIYRGVLTGLNEAFVIDEDQRNALIKEDKRSAEIIKPFLGGRDIKRYEFSNRNIYLIFTRRGINLKEYPAIEKHLLQFKKQLTPKPKDWKGSNWEGRKPGAYKWYEIQDSIDYYSEFEMPKLMLPDISQRGNFMYDTSGQFYSVNSTYIIGSSDIYLLGLLNSKLITFFYSNLSPAYSGGFYRWIYQFLVQIPIKKLDLANPSDKQQHDKLVSLVDQMLEAKKRLSTASRDTERDQLTRKCEYLDNEIDKLVYGLYGLTEEEIKVVEGN